jgi:hypothetical protein
MVVSAVLIQLAILLWQYRDMSKLVRRFLLRWLKNTNAQFFLANSAVWFVYAQMMFVKGGLCQLMLWMTKTGGQH